MKNEKIETLKERLREVSYLGSALGLLGWDQQVHMPVKGAEARGVATAYLSAIMHNKFVGIDADGLLNSLHKRLLAGNLPPDESVIVRETWRSFEREKKLPESFVKELSETTTRAYSAWTEARKKSDFKMFAPWLEKIVALKKREANYVGYRQSPYDSLLDAHEPEMKTNDAEKMLGELKEFLVPFVKTIKKSGAGAKPSILKGTFLIERQKEFNRRIAARMGFSFAHGRMDESPHPFTIGFHPHDVRITTRYRAHDALYAISSTIHETGHALYEQGLRAEHFGTPLGESVSYGIHESQSRLWENMVGKGMPFWRYFYPALRREFPRPFLSVPIGDFYRALNNVRPSLIRVEADEVTYNLHIVLRFEIEKALIEGQYRVSELPKVWNEKMREYLGITVPDNARGVLQDVHWSGGSFGYFPTYSLGNIYAGQFWHAARKDMPRLDTTIAKGNLLPLREWFRAHVHEYGKTFSARALVKKATGEEPSSGYYIAYLEKKYGEIYNIRT